MSDHVRNELIKGLTADPKYIPHWYMYDKDGSRYYDICCEQSKWFYFHRSETKLLRNNIQDIVGSLNGIDVLVDLGSGKALKTRILIDGLLASCHNITYIPVDSSVEYLGEMVTKIKEEYGDKLMVKPMATDYLEALKSIIIFSGNKLIVWIGGSLQNLSYEKQIQDLTAISRAMQSKDRLLITVDVTDSSDKTTIEQAYLDPEGDLDLTIKFQRGEKLFLHEGKELSCKYTIEQIKNICEKSSLSIVSYWTNEHVIALMLRRN